MQKKFELNRTKIKGGCQSGNSKSDLPVSTYVVRNSEKIKKFCTLRQGNFKKHFYIVSRIFFSEVKHFIL